MHIQEKYLDGYNKVLWKREKDMLAIYITRTGKIQFLFSPNIRIQMDCSVPDKAKLERAKPAVRIPTISQGGNPRSREDRVMQTAGDKKAIVWQIFRT